MGGELYYQDFLLEAGGDQCAWCGEVDQAEQFRVVRVDQHHHSTLPIGWWSCGGEDHVLLCISCIDSFLSTSGKGVV